RSPAVTALSAWSLARLSKGRFTLGLGSQVKGHIERRYGMRWSPPGPWLRDYVGALRAIWASWQNGTKLDYHSEHYTLSLMVPAARKGMAKAGRDGIRFTMCVMPLVATAPDLAALAAAVEDVRARVAFYASTPTYLAAFETGGHGETAKQLQALSRAQRWEE